MALVHHELCFGCGRVNLFGLMVELEKPEQDRVSGRCFVKQDHQGPVPGQAHPGLIATALIEAMTLLAGDQWALADVRIEFTGFVRVGTFLAVQAQLEAGGVAATVSAAGDQLASGTGSLEPCPRA